MNCPHAPDCVHCNQRRLERLLADNATAVDDAGLADEVRHVGRGRQLSAATLERLIATLPTTETAAS